MRNFDNWNSYIDLDGNLLHGKVRFCQKDTTDNVTIYNSDGDPVRNPEFTDMLGRTEYQVFVDNDVDVTAYFYKYVGTGELMGWPPEDYDPSRWALQYTSDDMDPVMSVDLTSDTANGVANIASLRDVVPDEVPLVDGAKLLWVYGYYQAGDTSPVMYIWDSASTDSDDGGSVIMADSVPGKGRWKLVTKELHFDVRHFGVFPTDDIYSTEYQWTSQLANCAAYLDAEGLDAWFPAIRDNLSYYLFNGTNTFSIKGDVYVSDAVRMHCKSGTDGTVIACHELHKTTPDLFVSTVQTGLATLTADWINISWLGGQVTGNARVGWRIDSDSYPRVIENTEVVFLTNGDPALQLINCKVSSNHKITGNIYIKDSKLDTDWFAVDYDYSKLTTVNNDIQLKRCYDANIYVYLKNRQGEADYGDLAEGTVINQTLLADSIIENATFDNVSIQGACEMHNVSGTVASYGGSLALNAVDCWLTLSAPSQAVSVELRRGAIGGASLQVTDNLFLDNVDILSTVDCRGADMHIQHSVIEAAITCNDTHLVDDDINAIIDQYWPAGDTDMDFLVENCRFHLAGSHHLAAAEANTRVVGSWTDNFSDGTGAPIVVDLTHINAQDEWHTYTYSNNTGRFLPRYPKQTVMNSNFLIYNSTGFIAANDPCLVEAGYGLPTIQCNYYLGVYIPDDYTYSMPFFAIGAAVAKIRMSVAWDFAESGGMSGSMSPTITQHYSCEGTKVVAVSTPSSYDGSAFQDSFIGEIGIEPKSFSSPEYAPGNGSQAIITLERLI